MDVRLEITIGEKPIELARSHGSEKVGKKIAN
jgi:hypothetical protein